MSNKAVEPRKGGAKPAPTGAVTKPQGKQPAKASPVQVVKTRNDFLSDGSKKLFLAAAIVLFGVIAQCFIAYVAFSAKSERVYIATDNSGSILTLIPLGQPNHKPEVVSQWVQHALVDTFSFNYSDYQTQLNESTMKWFTDRGASEFLREVNDAGYIQAVKDGELILSLVCEHTPILVSPAPAPNDKTGIWTWTFQVDAILTFRTKGKELTKKVRLTIWVERTSMLANADGLGIAKILMTNR